ncbi:MAG: DUF839 domain-containing protein [Bacteroidia bacterium]
MHVHRVLCLCFCLLGIGSLLQAQSFGNFTSILPQGQVENMVLPRTHNWQMLIQAGDPLPGGGLLPGSNDFTGYVPIQGSSTHGYLSISTEAIPGDVTILEVQYNAFMEKWLVLDGNVVDMSQLGDSNVAPTARNCSGAVTPWNTVITCEELESTTDLNGDGYLDWGWSIEIDPATHSVVDHNLDGKPDKLWALGHFRHENAAFAPDSVTVYQGEDATTNGFLFKFIAHEKMRLDSGELYVLHQSGNVGNWIRIPNETQWERNHTVLLADSLGGTDFFRIEDVEVNPLTGEIYFASTAMSRVYKFEDRGDSISGFGIFVDYGTYQIVSEHDTTPLLLTYPDNLVFDGDGNLWVAQDGGGAHLWVFGPMHSLGNPDVRIFTTAVRGAEPTGMTFTPDFRYLFMSFQHPFYSNVIPSVDATGQSFVFNRAGSFVFGLMNDLGTPEYTSGVEDAGMGRLFVSPNPTRGVCRVEGFFPENGTGEMRIIDARGQVVFQRSMVLQAGLNALELDLGTPAAGIYVVEMRCEDRILRARIVRN